MPFCRECGKKVQNDWVNCPYCSSKIQNNDVKIVSSTPNAVIVVPNEKKGSNGFIVLTVLGILALIFIPITYGIISPKLLCGGLLDTTEVTVQEDQSFIFEGINGCNSYTWIVEVEDGYHEFDIFWKDKIECAKWENRKSSTSLSSLSFEGMNEELSPKQMGPGSMDSGESYCLIIDNSDRGSSSPPWNGYNDPISVKIKIYGWATG